MGMQKEIKKAAKAEQKLLQKRLEANPLNFQAHQRWQSLEQLLNSFRNKS